METWVEREEVFSGPIFKVYTGQARLDDGQTARRDMVAHRGGVGVVAIHDDRVMLVRQFRLAGGADFEEIPAGLREPGEEPAACAARELAEELGYAAGRLIPLASYRTSPGFTDEVTAIFLALDLAPAEATPDWDERLHPVELPLAELDDALAAGRFEDGKTLVGLYAALAWLERQGR
ncbi:MAG: NUDIX hydrolase [Chloroflexales bacterium]|nr:NUDIX hydrolase [Chloroflexales bacterium]